MSASALLSEREERTLVLIARFRFLTSIQLQSFLFEGSRTTPQSQAVLARKTLRSLANSKLIQRLPRPLGGSGGGSSPHAYCLAPKGARVMAADGSHLPKRKVPQGTFWLRHALATADFALGLQRAAQAPGQQLVEWSCDWEIEQRMEATRLVPDAFFVYQAHGLELHAFVEIDLGSVNSKAFATKIGRYLDLFTSGTWEGRLSVWPTVLTLTPDAARARLLRRATESALAAHGGGVDAATEFAFAIQEDACRDPLGPIWETAGTPGHGALFAQGDQSG